MKRISTLFTLTLLLLLGGFNVAKAQVEIDGVWHYRLWVGDTEITLDNFDNITSSSIKSGKVDFDVDTVKITLENVNIEQANACIRDEGSCPKEVIIHFKGNNTLKSTGGTAIDLKNCDVIFRGPGTLNVTGDVKVGGNHSAIFRWKMKYNGKSNSINVSGGKLTVENGTFNTDIHCGNGTIEGGDFTDANLFPASGTLTLTNCKTQINNIEGSAGSIVKIEESEVTVKQNITGLNDLQLVNAEVTSPNGAYYDKSKKKMVDANGTELKSPANIVIKKKSTTPPEDNDKRTFTVSVTREVGLGYGVTNATVDLSSAEKFLGLSNLNDATLYAVKRSTGEFVDNAKATYDGWFNKEGDPQVWKENPFCCVKFFEAIPSGKFTICDKGGDGGEKPQVGETFTCQWALTANGKTALFNINVVFVEQGVYKPQIVKTINIGHVEMSNAAYCTAEEGPTFDVQEVCEALGIQDLNDATAYIVNVTTGNFVANTTDGWRDANGDACEWKNADNGFCLKLDDPASGQFNYTGAHDGNFDAGMSYLAQWGLVYDNKAVLLKVWILFDPNPAGIENQIVDRQSSNSDRFDLSGRKIVNRKSSNSKLNKGIYIQDGRKFIVK